MAKLEIQVQIKKTIRPLTPTPDNLRTLKLSVYDQMPQRVYVPMLLYYLPSSEGNRERCDKLQKSLAEILAANFYPIAGRFREEGFSIECNDEGVDYIEAKVNADLAEFLHDGPKIELLDDLLPWGVNPPDTSLPTSTLFAVQANLFNCGGLVIGVQISHLLGDSYTLATFLKEWARASRTGSTEGCLSKYGVLSELYPPKQLPDLSPGPIGGAKVVTSRFVFDGSSVAALMDKIESSGGTVNKLTKWVAVRALIWKVLVGISLAKHGNPRSSFFICPVYLRSKSDVPDIQHALGTFALSTIAMLAANDPKRELKDLANLIASAMGDPSLKIGYESIDKLYDPSNASPPENLGEMDFYICINWGGFPLYEADYGWGKPLWVSTVKQDAIEMITLFNTRDGGGVEAWINLKEDDMAEFEKDPELLTFAPPEKRQLIPKSG